jgi:signal transduction histidine kinase
MPMDDGHETGVQVEDALAGAWQGTDLPDVLEVIVEGVVRVAGFGVAALSVRTDPDGFEVVAVAGDQPGIEDLVGAHIPRSRLEAELAEAQHWGRLRFVPHGTMVQMPSWVPDYEPLDGPDAWHPLDLLLAPILDEDGTWVGMLSVDLPDSGRRPGPEQLRVLERYVEKATGALLRAMAQDRLHRRVRMSETAREVVRRASTRMSLDEVLDECRLLITDAFQAKGIWIDIAPSADGLDPGKVFVSSAENPDLVVPPALVEVGRQIAQRCWQEQRAVLVSRSRDRSDLIQPAQQRAVLEFLSTVGRRSVLMAPIGAGSEWLGTFVLSTDQEGSSWTEVEAQAALDIGRDLGAALQNARLRARDQRLVDELRALDGYKSQLIATIAHEFKNPLTSIVGNLERIQQFGDDPAQRTAALAALARGSSRLIELVDQLVELRRVSDPEVTRVVEPVDLGLCLREAAELVAVRVGGRSLEVSAPSTVVEGVRSELESVCTNLLDNALKYTDADGRVRAAVCREGDTVVLTVADDGLGINPADRERLGQEFFRSTNPEAVRRPGSGLGLAIVARVVERHHGTLHVESAPGRGSTFAVRLPAAG